MLPPNWTTHQGEICMQRLRVVTLTVSLGLVLMVVCSTALAQSGYQRMNLVSNLSGKALHTDPLLANPWGLAYSPGAPFWVSDAACGWSSFSPTQALIGATQSGAVYTGLAITSKASGNFLYAADSANNKVDVYDGNFSLVKSFTDSAIPAGFAPFGIQDINGQLYVTFASTSGGTGGYIDIFAEDGTLVKHFTHRAPLKQPWGLAVAPSNFGTFSDALLVTNNTSTGTINAFNLTTGKALGTLKTTTGKVITIPGLWGIEFGGGTISNGKTNQLFFTAGPNDKDGYFGAIIAK